MGSTYSAHEHLVPEQLFSTVENPVEGISAVKALAIASQQGQRIYTFTQDNLSYLSDLTVDQGTIDEIRTQVQNGMVATVHQHPISYAGWTGTGYTIIDPETGAGGYKISGGSDGGEILLDKELVNSFTVADLGVFFASLANKLIGVASTVYSGIGIVDTIINGNCNGDTLSTSLAVGLVGILIAISIVTLVAWPIFVASFGVLATNMWAIFTAVLTVFAFEDFEYRCT